MTYVAIPPAAATLTGITGLTDKQVVFGSSTGTGTSSADATYDDTTNDFTISASESGGTVGITAANSSNTASSDVAITAQVAGTSASDAVFRAIVNGTTTWSWGVDNSDSDTWKLAPNADVGTSPAISISTGGLAALGGAVVAGRTLTGYGAGTTYFRFVKASATAGTWDFGTGAAVVSGDNAFMIGDATSGSSIVRFAVLGTSAGAQTADVVIGAPASNTVPAVLTTTATGGFLRLSTCAGPPTGAAIDGSIVLDTTNNKCYVRSTAAWVALN